MSKVATDKSEDSPRADAQTPMWKNQQGEFVPMSEMSDQEILEAMKHSLYKMGQHSKRLLEARASLSKFTEKFSELQEECKSRELHMESNVKDEKIEDLNSLVHQIRHSM